MQTVIAIYGGGTLGRMKGEPLWTGLKVKITHGKSRKVNAQNDKVSELEKAVEQLKLEGYTSGDIREALSKMREEALKESKQWSSLDEYLDSLDED